MLRRSQRVIAAVLWVAVGGCGTILGLDDFQDEDGGHATGGGGSGASSTTVTNTTGDLGGGGQAGGHGGMGAAGGGGNGTGGTLCQPQEEQPCYTGPAGTEGKGACTGGVKVCNGDGSAFGPCFGQVLPKAADDCATPEDDDCNGAPNDGCPCAPSSTQPCYDGAAGTAGVGICHAGSQTCNAQGTIWGPCVGEQVPLAETCLTADDDDCDGQTNEEGAGCVCAPNTSQSCYSGPAGTQGVGQCKAGTQICNGQGTAWGPCIGEVLPGLETCVGTIDEDCDGSACGVTVWSKIWGDVDNQHARGAGTDVGGNLYLVGDFAGAVQFGPSALVSAGASDVFVVKLDESGNHVWSKRFGDAMTQEARSIAVTSSGAVVIVGQFAGTVDFGGGPLTGAAGSLDVFVAKFDANGTHAWSKRFGDASVDLANSVAIDSSGSVLVAGQYGGTPDFGAGPFPAPTGTGSYLLKLAGATGATTWSKPFAGTSGLHGEAVATDSTGNVVGGGDYAGTVDGGCGPVTSTGSFDAFATKRDPNGTCVWFKAFGSAGFQGTSRLAVDTGGSILVAGRYSGTLDPGGGLLTSAGGDDIWLAKYSTGGTHFWSKSLGGTLTDRPYALAASAGGEVFVGGGFQSSVNFGGSLLTSAGSSDCFVARYDSSGGHVWSGRLGGTADDQASALAVRGAHTLYVFGEFASPTIDLGNGSLTNAGGTDIFLAKIGQ